MKSVLISGINTNDIKVLDEKMVNYYFDLYKNNNDLFAREHLINGNLRLVLSCVKNFNNKSECLDDLFQIGVIGLCKAIDNFNPNFGVKLSTYAIPMINGEIRRYLRDNNLIRVSRSIKDLAYKVLSLKEKLTNINGVVPTSIELADALGVSVSDVNFAISAMYSTVSMYESVYSDSSDTIMLYEQLKDESEIMDIDTKLMINECIDNLSEREREILYRRFIYGNNQVELAKKLNISQAQVSRIESNAIKSLRYSLK